MKVLLSPAKSIDTNNTLNINSYSQAHFIDKSELLVSKLKKISSKKLGTLMGISPELSNLNFERYQKWVKPECPSKDVVPAIAAFTGEVYRGFDATSLSMQELVNAQDTVRILSGLYGVLKPLDLICPYRLEMGTKWIISSKIPNLYKFWGKTISDFLNEELQNQESIINLASAEYFKVVDSKKINASIITPIFKEFKNGEYKVIMTFAKQARGAMARFIVQNKITNPELIKTFATGGYQFDANLSNEKEWIFTR
jgi:uncharacterized protein